MSRLRPLSLIIVIAATLGSSTVLTTAPAQAATSNNISAVVGGAGAAPAPGAAPNIPISYCQAGWSIHALSGEIIAGAQGTCSQAIYEITTQMYLYSNDGTVLRANSGVQTAFNTQTGSAYATSQCGSSCASWNWWLGVFFISFTSLNGWTGSPSGICTVNGETMNCNGDTSTFNYNL